MKIFSSLGLLAAFVSNATAFVPSNGSYGATSSRDVSVASTSKQGNTDFVNEAELLEASDFAIPADKLLERAREVLSPTVSLGIKDGGECLADDFEFVAAVVGPIGRKEYLNALGTFKLEDSFDIEANNFGFSVDPMQPNRVWFFNRVKGIHKGTFMGAEPTGKEIVYPPQIHHIDFNEDGKIKEYGFYTADRRQGNTGGLGGAFGFMYGVGKPLPIPECQPFKRSFRFRMLNFVGGIAQKFAKKKEAEE